MATGFIAKNQSGQVTTLKRNGSDYSATIMGALVRSSNIVIWTDVDGVFSADPRKVSPAPANQTHLCLCCVTGWSACMDDYALQDKEFYAWSCADPEL